PPPRRSSRSSDSMWFRSNETSCSSRGDAVLFSTRIVLLLAFAAQAAVVAHGWTRWKATTGRPLSVAAALEIVREAPDGSWHRVEPGSTLASGDRSQLTVKLSEAAFLEVYYDTPGEPERIFPVPGAAPVLLPAGTYAALPSP